MSKVRTIITTDMEVDDMNSLIHLCLYLNEMNVLGIVYTSSQYHFNGNGIHTLGEITPNYRTSGLAGLERPRKSHGPDPKGKDLKSFRPFPVGWIENLWKNEYAKAYPYLIQHDESFPSPDYLLSVTKYGNIEFEGDVRCDTEGSNLIKSYLVDDCMEPLYIQSWGGINTVVRALLSIYDEYHDTEAWSDIYHRVVGKTRILGVHNKVGQDNSYLDNKIDKLYPDLVCLSTEYIYGVYRASITSQKDCIDMFKADWMLKNIHNHTSELMDAYHLMGDGRRIEGEAEVYQFGLTAYLDFGFPGVEPFCFDKYDFIGEGDSNTYIPLIQFGLRGLEDPAYPTLLGRLFSDESTKPSQGNIMTGKGIRINPFMRAYQEDFAARAKWCCNDYQHANHAPIVTIENKDIYAKKGEIIDLNASVYEPDNDAYYSLWEYYEQYSNYEGEGSIGVWEAWKLNTCFAVPEDARANDHFTFILRVQDDAETPMTSFGQMVVHIVE